MLIVAVCPSNSVLGIVSGVLQNFCLRLFFTPVYKFTSLTYNIQDAGLVRSTKNQMEPEQKADRVGAT